MNAARAAQRSLTPRALDALRGRVAARRDAGFTLIEVLVVILIIAVLAAISIPMFMAMQQEAHRSSVETDVHHLAVAIESERVYNEGVLTLPPASDVAISSGVTIELFLNDDALTYYLRGSNASLNGGTTYYYYGTAEGGVIGWSDEPDFVTPEPLDGDSETYANP